jgi:hypothetical protein
MSMTYVLVHGGWQGGWSYRRVARLLRKAGHEVYTPTLTGLGERSHLAHMQINLDTHITDVANTILWEDLSDIIPPWRTKLSIYSGRNVKSAAPFCGTSASK